ncbi:glycosyltransferase family 10 domain-containing protein [Chamaesiphon sp. VAR_48_metabat_135_sub]|uniref:glycosyltransferase family 10 domain-containing protein n=1 Tax=Chamaesiphon sp. VAR_48_metabat_135_sub TaxID=2964699 RepID=UPI00286C9114|nr:glycosyltransferase family 10 [Chamaesiphon sp. VAR_48_metabat_135_sub]
MNKIKIAFCDFPGLFNPTKIQSLLRQRFDIEVTNEDPDYVIYSIFGHEFIKYENAVRIFFVGENVRPDFNLCDYAFTYDWLTFGDRHFRAPNFVLYDQYLDICARQYSQIESIQAKSKFCNFIYTNNQGHPIRDLLFWKLSEYKQVDAAGAHLNNIPQIGLAYTGDWSADKIEFQKHYKFTIACENSSSPGYTTEKLIHALCADTIPIYWGDPEVGQVFNTDRFIDLNSLSLAEAVHRVREIDSNDALFMEIVSRPFFKDKVTPYALSHQAILAKFEQIFSQPKASAFRRNFYFWGKKYEHRRREEIRAHEIVNKD